PYTIADYLKDTKPGKVKADHPECAKSIDDVRGSTKKLLSINGNRTPFEFIRELGTLMWNNCGMARSKESLTEAIAKIPAIREEFRKNVKVSGTGAEFNQQLENAGRTADFLEFAELICRDALHRDESCGGHFRVEHQYADGEAKRNDADFAYAAAWEFKGVDKEPELHKEPLKFENIHLAVRSYK
ncbi:MAG: fumarate reductase/succinate dehydrogenase flavoprotein subunit, partial [Deltaproteobacteria bacterium]|nr:fumarate reductase/succinate dehydrogenase flavoprotein subunit [Deltaproteobacteria bacterium]